MSVAAFPENTVPEKAATCLDIGSSVPDLLLDPYTSDCAVSNEQV